MKVYKDYPLSEILWYRIGGKARYVLEITSKEDVLEALVFIKENHIEKTLIVGSGSNLLVSGNYYNGVVLHFVSDTNSMEVVNNQYVEVFAGQTIENFIQFCFSNNLIGLEWAGGLPGTVGGAARGNAGAFGGDISKNIFGITCVRLSDPEKRILALDYSDLSFGYRTSIIKQQKDIVILSATFKLTKTSKDELEEAKKVYQSHILHRQKNNPLDYPSCGSTFKNISDPKQIKKIVTVFPDITKLINSKWHGKVAVGYLIKRLGFSGYKNGNAQVSEKHANFIVNLGGATFRNVFDTIALIQEKFQQTFGFTPEPEVEIVTF